MAAESAGSAMGQEPASPVRDAAECLIIPGGRGVPAGWTARAVMAVRNVNIAAVRENAVLVMVRASGKYFARKVIFESASEM